MNLKKQVALHSNSNTTSKHTPQVERNYWFLYAKQPIENHRGQTPNENVIDLKDNSKIDPEFSL